jgi:hypothetical protein
MLLEPNCAKRRCRHLRGVEWLGKEEDTEVCVCAAFPDGIPDEIAYGDDLHLKPRPGQGNDVVFEEGEADE